MELFRDQRNPSGRRLKTGVYRSDLGLLTQEESRRGAWVL